MYPRSNLSLALAGTTLDPLAELQSLKGLKPGAILRLVEGTIVFFFLSLLGFLYFVLCLLALFQIEMLSINFIDR